MIAIKDGSVEIIREETKMRPIKEGDAVTVCMARGGCFDFQIYPQISMATVLHVPVSIGDIWWFRVGEVEFAVNPCSSDFVGLILEAGGNDCSLYAQLKAPPTLCGCADRIIGGEGAVSPPTRWTDWPGRHTVRIVGGDGD